MYTPDQHLGDKRAAMSVGAARSIARQSHKVHTDPALRNNEGKPSGFNGPSIGIFDAIVIVKIFAGSGTSTLGTGSIQLYFYDPDNPDTLKADPTGDDGAGVCFCYCWFKNISSIPAGTRVKVHCTPRGYEVISWDC